MAENGSAAAMTAAIARLRTVRYSDRARRRAVVGGVDREWGLRAM
jgi:hypothetical protein